MSTAGRKSETGEGNETRGKWATKEACSRKRNPSIKIKNQGESKKEESKRRRKGQTSNRGPPRRADLVLTKQDSYFQKVGENGDSS